LEDIRVWGCEISPKEMNNVLYNEPRNDSMLKDKRVGCELPMKGADHDE
jgi:hypothetical protein